MKLFKCIEIEDHGEYTITRTMFVAANNRDEIPASVAKNSTISDIGEAPSDWYLRTEINLVISMYDDKDLAFSTREESTEDAIKFVLIHLNQHHEDISGISIGIGDMNIEILPSNGVTIEQNNIVENIATNGDPVLAIIEYLESLR